MACSTCSIRPRERRRSGALLLAGVATGERFGCPVEFAEPSGHSSLLEIVGVGKHNHAQAVVEPEKLCGESGHYSVVPDHAMPVPAFDMPAKAIRIGASIVQAHRRPHF